VFYESLNFSPFNDPSVQPVLSGYGYAEGFGVPSTYGDNVTATSMPDPDAPLDGVFQYGAGAEGFTPNVSVSYGPFSLFTGGPELWREDYGDLNGVLYQGSRPTGIGTDYNILDVVLVAEPGYEVQLYGFDLGSHLVDRDINSVSIYDGVPFPFLTPTNYLTGGGPFTALSIPGPDPDADPDHYSFDFGTPLASQVIWIRIDANNLAGLDNESRWIGIDNIRFGQAVNASNTLILTEDEINAAFQSAEVPEPATMTLLLVGGAGLAMENVRRRRRNR
jgi:hypothetical protein